jgi:hypothetical protein
MMGPDKSYEKKEEVLVEGVVYSVYCNTEDADNSKKAKCSICGRKVDYYPVTVELVEVYEAEGMTSIDINAECNESLMMKIIREAEKEINRGRKVCSFCSCDGCGL